MSNQTSVAHPLYSLLPTDVEGFDSLAKLALDMRSLWNHATDQGGGSWIRRWGLRCCWSGGLPGR